MVVTIVVIGCDWRAKVVVDVVDGRGQVVLVYVVVHVQVSLVQHGRLERLDVYRRLQCSVESCNVYNMCPRIRILQ